MFTREFYYSTLFLLWILLNGVSSSSQELTEIEGKSVLSTLFETLSSSSSSTSCPGRCFNAITAMACREVIDTPGVCTTSGYRCCKNLSSQDKSKSQTGEKTTNEKESGIKSDLSRNSTSAASKPSKLDSVPEDSPAESSTMSKKDFSSGLQPAENSQAVPYPSITMEVCPGVCVAKRISNYCEAAIDGADLCKRDLRCCVPSNLFDGVQHPPKEFVILNPSVTNETVEESRSEVPKPPRQPSRRPPATTTREKPRSTTATTPTRPSIVEQPKKHPSEVSSNTNNDDNEGIPPEKQCKGTCVAGFFAFLCDRIDRSSICPRGGKCCMAKGARPKPEERPRPEGRPKPGQRPRPEVQNQEHTTSDEKLGPVKYPRPEIRPRPDYNAEDENIKTRPLYDQVTSSQTLDERHSFITTSTTDRTTTSSTTTTTTTEIPASPCVGSCLPVSVASRCQRPSRLVVASGCRFDEVCCDDRAKRPSGRPSGSNVPQALGTLLSLFGGAQKEQRPPPQRRRPRPTTTTTTTTTTPSTTTEALPECPGTCIAPILSFTCFSNAEITDLFRCSKESQLCCAPKSAIRGFNNANGVQNAIARNDTALGPHYLINYNHPNQIGNPNYDKPLPYPPIPFERPNNFLQTSFNQGNLQEGFHAPYYPPPPPPLTFNEPQSSPHIEQPSYGEQAPPPPPHPADDRPSYRPSRPQSSLSNQQSHFPQYGSSETNYPDNPPPEYSSNDYQNHHANIAQHPPLSHLPSHQQTANIEPHIPPNSQHYPASQASSNTPFNIRPQIPLQSHFQLSSEPQPQIPSQPETQIPPKPQPQPQIPPQSHPQIPPQVQPQVPPQPQYKIPFKQQSNAQSYPQQHQRYPESKEQTFSEKKESQQWPVYEEKQTLRYTYPPRLNVTYQRSSTVPTIDSSSVNTTSLVSSQYVCGVKGSSRKARVVGGEDAVPGEWCWQVALINSLNQYLCGGALIGTQWVLTAAHCVTNIVRSGDAIYVRVGDHDLTTRLGSPGAQTIPVATTYIHHNHNSQTLDNDIALLKLSNHADLGEGVCLVCLPARGVSQVAGKRCTVTGYGYMGETGPIPLRIREAEIPVVSEGECIRKINAVTEKVFILPASSFCAGGEDGHDACQGDGGGPLVCKVDDYFELSGLVSWGFGCGRHDVPGVYVKVSSFIGWINQIISVNNT